MAARQELAEKADRTAYNVRYSSITEPLTSTVTLCLHRMPPTRCPLAELSMHSLFFCVFVLKFNL